MKTIVIVLLLLITLSCFSQTDSTTSIRTSIFSIKTDSLTGQQTLIAYPQMGRPQPTITTRGNISLATYNLKSSFVENQIADLESEECNALKKRDQITLQRLWAKDFTIDTKQNELVTSDNPLPNYLSFSRLIERITIIDSNTAFTSGYETYQQFTTGVSSTPLTIRRYFHAWTKFNGLWRLTTKKHE